MRALCQLLCVKWGMSMTRNKIRQWNEVNIFKCSLSHIIRPTPRQWQEHNGDLVSSGQRPTEPHGKRKWLKPGGLYDSLEMTWKAARVNCRSSCALSECWCSACVLPLTHLNKHFALFGIVRQFQMRLRWQSYPPSKGGHKCDVVCSNRPELYMLESSNTKHKLFCKK